MTIEIIILIVAITFIFTMLLGLSISSVLIISGLIGIFLTSGYNPVVSILQIETFSTVASYTLTTIPLFVLMSQYIIKADIVKYLYSLIFIFSKGKAVILGIFTVILGGFLGAVSGSASAMSAALGQFAVPELEKHGYKKNFAASIAAAAGSLSTVIPPSIGLIVYGAITQTSIGSLFIAITIPGILTIIVLSLIIVFIYLKDSKNNKEIVTDESQERYPIKNYIISVGTGLLIMSAIFGGIYSGIFTPTEAGGVGAFITLIAAVLLGKVNFKFFKETTIETLKITSFVMMIMIGATIFSRFVSLSRLPSKLIEVMGPISNNSILIIIILIAIFFVAFMFLEGAAGIVMLVPITLPLAVNAGLSPLEFGVLITVVGTAGLMTPPVGISTFSVSGVLGISSTGVFKYTMIYAIAITIIVIGLLLIFPPLINWLPDSMNG